MAQVLTKTLRKMALNFLKMFQMVTLKLSMFLLTAQAILTKLIGTFYFLFDKSFGKTALLLASEKSQFEFLEFLLKHGANIEAKDL